MSRRNVWLNFSEWELINEELSDCEYHFFQLSQKQVAEWKKDMKKHPHREDRVFERVGIYPMIQKVKSPKAINILCRENWRSQDMIDVMENQHSFIGFILTHLNDVSINTTLEEWEEIRNKMKSVICESDKRLWFDNDLIDLYKKTNK
jgi:hypothetical protein